MTTNIAVLASGRGSNLQGVIDACKRGLINGKVCVVISNNKDAQALERAQKENIPTEVIHHINNSKLLDTLQSYDAELVVLAGYLQKVGPRVIEAYPDKIINVHPSLLPKYGGKGMYGLAVHEAVIAAGDDETGVTIHFVTPEYDEGEIIEQLRIRVHENATPQELADRLINYEAMLLVHTIRRIIGG